MTQLVEICGEEKEDLIHFIIKCKSLETKRNCNLIKGNIEEQEERMKDVLYRNRNNIGVSKMIMNMQNLRKNLLEEKLTVRLLIVTGEIGLYLPFTKLNLKKSIPVTDNFF